MRKSRAQALSYVPAERASALAKLMRFAARPKFEKLRRAAFSLFWGDWLLKEPAPWLDEVMNSEQMEIAYNSWFAFDFDCGDGRRMLEIFLEAETERLSSGELNYLLSLRAGHLRLYEILEVKPDQGLDVRDLWDDRRFFVSERAATRQLVTWDLVVARLGSAGDGKAVFEAVPYCFRAADKDDLLTGIKKAHRTFREAWPEKDMTDFFRTMAPVFHSLWLERVAEPPRMTLLAGDGEPLIFARVIFDLLDREAAMRSVADRDDVDDQGDGSYIWLEPAGAFRRALGTIRFEKKRVVLEATSKKRAEKARDELPSLLGGSVRFRAISYEDVERALERAPQPRKEKPADIPMEAKRQILGDYYEKHYRKWLDESVPALGHRTPRRAAQLKTVRPRLIALLKDFESHSERQRRAGEIAYDFTWMWEELGLTRE